MEIDDNFMYLNPQILENLSREETKYLEVSKQIAKGKYRCLKYA